MSFTKPALGLAVALALSACAPMLPVPQGAGASAAPVTSRAARTPGILTEIDIVRAVQSSL